MAAAAPPTPACELARALARDGCVLCGEREARRLFRDGPWSVVRCEGCGLVFLAPRPSAQELVEQVYDASYWRSAAPRERGYADYLGDEDLHLRTFERRAAVVERQLPASGRGSPPRVLDVGCASGAFLRVMRSRGWEVFGFEPSEPMRREAARSLGSARIRGGELAGAFEPGNFDLVTLWDVLEHASDPIELLATCARALRPAGRLALETQDVGSLAARALGRRWTHFKQPEHLFHFDRRSLVAALERAGLAPVLLTRRGAGKYVSPDFVVERSGRLHPLLPRLFAPLRSLLPRAVYVNPLDEWIAVAARREE